MVGGWWMMFDRSTRGTIVNGERIVGTKAKTWAIHHGKNFNDCLDRVALDPFAWNEIKVARVCFWIMAGEAQPSRIAITDGYPDILDISLVESRTQTSTSSRTDPQRRVWSP